WSQREVADRWNARWPDEPKTFKNVSYWEVWPSPTGHEPSLIVLDRLALLYQCSVVDLLADLADYRHLDDPPPPPPPPPPHPPHPHTPTPPPGAGSGPGRPRQRRPPGGGRATVPGVRGRAEGRHQGPSLAVGMGRREPGRRSPRRPPRRTRTPTTGRSGPRQ